MWVHQNITQRIICEISCSLQTGQLIGVPATQMRTVCERSSLAVSRAARWPDRMYNIATDRRHNHY